MDSGSQAIFSEALQTWRRIEKRFSFSAVWKHAPREVIAAEFLSVLRFALAPRRIEIALYIDGELIASTQPKKLVPIVDGEGAIEIPIDRFFKEGNQAIEQWMLDLPENQNVVKTIDEYTRYFSGFKKPTKFECEGLAVSILSSRDDFDSDFVRRFIKASKIAGFLAQRGAGNPISFAGELRPLIDGLTDPLLESFLDRLENDLAAVIDVEAPDIWILRADGEKQKLNFGMPREKRMRFSKKDGRPVKIEEIRRRVDGDDGHEDGAFKRNLISCQSGEHVLKWDDEEGLTPAHVACLAEKFTGWPMDTGIAGTVVSTGCSEVLENFGEDYRVLAYSAPEVAERFDEFYEVQLAERVFISRRPHLVEIPLLWSLDDGGMGRCAAILLVTFKQSDFAQRAFKIAGAVESWYLLFEQHGRLVQEHRLLKGDMVHDINNAIIATISELGKFKIERPEAIRRLEDLCVAHAFVSDERVTEKETVVASDFIGRVMVMAESKISDSRRVLLDSQLGRHGAEKIEVVVSLIERLLPRFIASSHESLTALSINSRADVTEDLNIYLKSYPSVANGKSQLVLEMKHRAIPRTVSFIDNYGPIMGHKEIYTESDGKKHAHQGILFLRSRLRQTEAEFLRPKLDQNRQYVTWTFQFPFLEKIDL
jgi:hypothetical protein